MRSQTRVVRIFFAVAALFVAVPLALMAEALALRHSWETPGIFLARHVMNTPVTNKLSALGSTMAVWLVTDTLCYVALLYGLFFAGDRLRKRLHKRGI